MPIKTLTRAAPNGRRFGTREQVNKRNDDPNGVKVFDVWRDNRRWHISRCQVYVPALAVFQHLLTSVKAFASYDLRSRRESDGRAITGGVGVTPGLGSAAV